MSNTLKKAMVFMFNTIIITGIIYLASAFICGSWNIINANVGGKFLAVLVWFCFMCGNVTFTMAQD